MEKTAVEWLEDNIQFDMTFMEILGLIRQAKEMEKQQKIDFARHCLNKAKDLDILSSFMNVEQYYNETFKSE